MPTAYIFHPAPRAYYEWLGRFVEAFAGVELLLFHTLTHHAKLPEDMAAAVFSGTRGKDAISFINRLCEINPIEKEDAEELKDVFSQFNAINDIRNFIIHHGTSGDKFFTRTEERKTSNRPRAHAERAVKEYRVTTNLLRELVDDLVKISEHLHYQIVFAGELSIAERAEASPILGLAWLYKRPGQ